MRKSTKKQKKLGEKQSTIKMMNKKCLGLIYKVHILTKIEKMLD